MIEELLAELLLKAGVRSARQRARQLYTLLEGATALMLVHGDRGYASAAAKVGSMILDDRSPNAVRVTATPREGACEVEYRKGHAWYRFNVNSLTAQLRWFDELSAPAPRHHGRTSQQASPGQQHIARS
jgi:hypothetical protein